MLCQTDALEWHGKSQLTESTISFKYQQRNKCIIIIFHYHYFCCQTAFTYYINLLVIIKLQSTQTQKLPVYDSEGRAIPSMVFYPQFSHSQAKAWFLVEDEAISLKHKILNMKMINHSLPLTSLSPCFQCC